jgi:hypothetical protein
MQKSPGSQPAGKEGRSTSFVCSRARAAAIDGGGDPGGETCQFSADTDLGERREMHMIIYQARAHKTSGCIDGLAKSAIFCDINDFSIVDDHIGLFVAFIRRIDDRTVSDDQIDQFIPSRY